MYLVRILIFNVHLHLKNFSFAATNKWRFKLLLRSNPYHIIIIQKMYCSYGANIKTSLFFYKALAPKGLQYNCELNTYSYKY